MGDDPLEAGVSREYTAEQEVADRAGGLEHELQHRAGPAERDLFVGGAYA